eukprot:SAG11_NODE_55_length_19449_cov_28.630135_7_plen_56_part_00
MHCLWPWEVSRWYWGVVTARIPVAIRAEEEEVGGQVEEEEEGKMFRICFVPTVNI